MPHAEPITSEIPKAEIELQLDRLLRSGHFRNSRRYPALLRYIVEQALEGNAPQLKERTLGVEVFGRPADYDTAADPIVRVTVAEVRKRIAQYYHEEAHASELRIELTPGSYVPEFLAGREAEEHAPEPVVETSRAPLPVADENRARGMKLWPLAVGVLVLLAAGVAIYAWRAQRQDAQAQLWQPIFDTPGVITYCLPMNTKKNGPGSADTTSEAISHVMDIAGAPVATGGTFFDHELQGENVVYSDVVAMMKLEPMVERLHRPVRVRLNFGTSLNDFREGPTIFFGGLNNQWTLQLLESLRYRFAGSDESSFYIRDANDPGNRQWSVRLKDKMTTVNRDYAIVARLHSEEQGKPVMIVAGIGMSGTAAAGEFLADPQAARDLQKRMGPALKTQDFEVVLQTDVVDGIAGPPKILALDLR